MPKTEMTVPGLALELDQLLRSKESGLDGDLAVYVDALRQDVYDLHREMNPQFRLAPGFSYLEVLQNFRKNHKQRAARNVRKKATELRRLVRTAPKYKNAEFKCVADFDKCRVHRGRMSTICALAFFLCMAKRGMPVLKEVVKAGTKLAGS
jgi:hypothetical protein